MNITLQPASPASPVIDGVPTGALIVGGFDALILAQTNVGEAQPVVAGAVAPLADASLAETPGGIPVATADMLATLNLSAAMLPRAQAAVSATTGGEHAPVEAEPGAVPAAPTPPPALAQATLPVGVRAASGSGSARPAAGVTARREGTSTARHFDAEIDDAATPVDADPENPALPVTPPAIAGEPVNIAAVVIPAQMTISAGAEPPVPAAQPETLETSAPVSRAVAAAALPAALPTPLTASAEPNFAAKTSASATSASAAPVRDGGKGTTTAKSSVVDLVPNLPPAPVASLEVVVPKSAVEALTASTPTVAVDRHLDMARGDAWLNDLARDIAATATQGGRLKFALAPEMLGRLDVEVRQSDAGISVHLAARNETARDMLTAAQPRIVDEIRAQGVRVAGTEVFGGTTGFGGDRSGNTPRPPSALPIDVARATADAPLNPTPEAAADGRYA